MTYDPDVDRTICAMLQDSQRSLREWKQMLWPPVLASAFCLVAMVICLCTHQAFVSLLFLLGLFSWLRDIPTTLWFIHLNKRAIETLNRLRSDLDNYSFYMDEIKKINEEMRQLL